MAREKTTIDPSFHEKIKTLAITGIFSDDKLLEKLVLKGGNLLDLVFRISPRASADVDISMDGEFDGTVDELRDRIGKGLAATFSDAGYVVFDLTANEVPPF